MSSHISCIHIQSNESNAGRLPSSGSDGSACDLFSDGALYSGHVHGSDETASTRSTCCSTLRWSSSSSERGRSYMSAKSLDGDNRSAHQLTFSSCVNPYLQNYDVPRTAFCSSRLSVDSGQSQMTESPYVSDVLSLTFAKDLDLSSDDANSTSTDSTFCSHAHSSSSNCSSDCSSGSSFLNLSAMTTGPTLLQQQCAPSLKIRFEEPLEHHHPASMYSNYQVPRTAIANIRLKDMQREHSLCHQQQ